MSQPENQTSQGKKRMGEAPTVGLLSKIGANFRKILATTTVAGGMVGAQGCAPGGAETQPIGNQALTTDNDGFLPPLPPADGIALIDGPVPLNAAAPGQVYGGINNGVLYWEEFRDHDRRAHIIDNNAHHDGGHSQGSNGHNNNSGVSHGSLGHSDKAGVSHGALSHSEKAGVSRGGLGSSGKSAGISRGGLGSTGRGMSSGS